MFVLALFPLLPLLILSLVSLGAAAAAELPLAAEVAVLGATEPLLAQRFHFHGQKILIGLEESLEKLLLISFFWSSIKRADSRRSFKLMCFSANSGTEIDGFKVSLNFSTR